ncbi:LuxR C-terminal-related transcriptional regulator [Phreatobacter sp. AB_2022a]|uniref:LuxR C-terminal-related transcriptional regulator n=1 Tax=Phreatobacter sp. AB_2022a TaxID=3003134 RepID=UPI0022871596|nr:LuxR C-terminal-related transcriptional regulator [Phreatobacter sp. AB_2022a]MCZ0734137.1 LuxR C-terminal-related transcriptional regulator [Phreatobacter sp. AB_2022a]
MSPCHAAAVSAADIGHAALNVAASRTLLALGEACHREIVRLIGSPTVGFYLLDGSKPNLCFARQAPAGFIREYRDEFNNTDPLLDYILDKQEPVDGATLIGEGAWKHCRNFQLLKRWGLSHCMAGPVFIEEKLAGLVYTANAGEVGRYRAAALDRMQMLCRAASLALTTMAETGRLDGPPGDRRVEAVAPLPKDQVPSGASDLPSRLREVALLLCQGRSNKEIARDLGISSNTVKDHISKLCQRLGAHNRTEVVHRLLTR